MTPLTVTWQFRPRNSRACWTLIGPKPSNRATPDDGSRQDASDRWTYSVAGGSSLLGSTRIGRVNGDGSPVIVPDPAHAGHRCCSGAGSSASLSAGCTSASPTVSGSSSSSPAWPPLAPALL